jgi:L-lysine 2,3-aminomutase
MIQTAPATGQPEPRDHWSRQLAGAIRDPGLLLRRLGLVGRVDLPSPEVLARFPLLVTEAYLSRIRPADASDPLLRQVLPVADEDAPGGSEDPVGEAAAEIAPGVLRKYAGRALLVTTAACAIHCRYCFRRHYPYGPGAATADWSPALAAAAEDPAVSELILSGGDPLMLSDRRLGSLTAQLAELPRIRRLRLHTRLPIVVPDRVDDGLLAWVSSLSIPLVMVVHVNHAHEIDTEVGAALTRLRGAGVTLLNQSVLLRGINDSAAALAALSERLFRFGVLPYYLHQFDPVVGAMHFAVADATAQRIDQELRTRLPGYLVPRLVREVAGAPAKLPL